MLMQSQTALAAELAEVQAKLAHSEQVTQGRIQAQVLAVVCQQTGSKHARSGQCQRAPAWGGGLKQGR